MHKQYATVSTAVLSGAGVRYARPAAVSFAEL